MGAAELSELEAVLGRHFEQPGLLEQALTHGSVRHERQTQQAHPTNHPATDEPPVADNERLEFLGDAIVGLVVAELLYRRYPDLDEGDLTRLRAALVSRKHLGQVGTTLGLGSYLRLGKAEERSGGRKKTVLLANCVEALVAALYLEGGLTAASRFIDRVVASPYLDELRDKLRVNSAIGDYKSALQELLQARHSGQPVYLLQHESGPDHRKRFVVEVRVGDEPAASAEGTTKKKAEQEAARLAYERLGERSPGRREGDPILDSLVLAPARSRRTAQRAEPAPPAPKSEAISVEPDALDPHPEHYPERYEEPPVKVPAEAAP